VVQATSEQHVFFQAVWAYVRQVPIGRVVSYGQIAQALPPPDDVGPEEYRREGARLVGNAMAACPEGVPWHRVVNAQGGISSRAGAKQQRQLLESEGLVLVDGRLDMRSAQWFEPGSQAAPAQQSLF